MAENYTQSAEWKRLGQQLRAGRKPSKRKAVDEMDLSEALEAQSKYLEWQKRHEYDKLEIETRAEIEAENGDPESWYFRIPNEDHRVVVHKYQNYLLPRIEDLKAHEEHVANVQHFLIDGKTEAELSHEQLSINAAAPFPATPDVDRV